MTSTILTTPSATRPDTSATDIEDGIETEIDADDAESSQPPSSGDGAIGDRLRRVIAELGARDLFLLTAIFLLPCAYFPIFNSWYWTARVMILLVAIPPGALALGWLLRTRDRAAILASAAILWSLLGALGAEPISNAVHGVIGQDASVLSYAGAIGLWALARCSSQRARRLALPVLLSSLGLNLVVGFAQVLFGLDRGDLSLQYGRAVGMTPNAVYFGALMAAGAALAMWQAASGSPRRWTWWCGAALLFGSCVTFSGSRVAAGAVVVVGAALVVTATRRRLALLGLSCSLFGMLAGSALARVFDLGGDSVSRLSNTGSGGRMSYWRAAVEAISERPVQGWGLGQFRAAVQGRLSLEELVPFGNAQPFWDAHNVFIGLAVAVGIPGLILFLSFAWVSGRNMPPHLVPAVGAIAITWMLQPGGLTTLPLVVLLLGFSRSGAGHEGTPRPPARRWQRIGVVALVMTGVAAALWVGVADARLELAVQAGAPVAAQAAASMFGDDPVANDVVAKMLESEGYFSEEQQAAILDAFERNTEIEPGRAFWWTQLARRQGQFGDPEAALVSTQRALDIEPFNQDAWAVAALIGRDLDDEQLTGEALDVLCTYGNEAACDQLVAQQ